jgi:hypothetical protein
VNVSTNGFALAPEPAVQSTVTFGAVTGTSMDVNFTGGSGSHRILVARAGASVSWSPTDGNGVAGVNSMFSSALDQGDGNKAVYDGPGSGVAVTGLLSGTTYHFAVYEYNIGTGNSQNYNTVLPGTGSNTTESVPSLSISPASIAFGPVEINTTSIERTYTLTGMVLTPPAGTITVSAPGGYKVSATSGSGFTTSLAVPYTGGSLPSITIYAIFEPTTVASYSGTILHAGGGAAAETVLVTGEGVAPTQPNVFEAENGILSSAYIGTQFSGYS